MLHKLIEGLTWKWETFRHGLLQCGLCAKAKELGCQLWFSGNKLRSARSHKASLRSARSMNISLIFRVVLKNDIVAVNGGRLSSAPGTLRVNIS